MLSSYPAPPTHIRSHSQTFPQTPTQTVYPETLRTMQNPNGVQGHPNNTSTLPNQYPPRFDATLNPTHPASTTSASSSNPDQDQYGGLPYNKPTSSPLQHSINTSPSSTAPSHQTYYQQQQQPKLLPEMFSLYPSNPQANPQSYSNRYYPSNPNTPSLLAAPFNPHFGNEPGLQQPQAQPQGQPQYDTSGMPYNYLAPPLKTGMVPRPSPRQPSHHARANSAGSNTVYSFVPLPGAQQQKRPRRRYEEIERIYHCNFESCSKAYGTLNHLNAHVMMQKHGPKRIPDEFREARREHKARKKEQEKLLMMRTKSESDNGSISGSSSNEDGSSSHNFPPFPSSNNSQASSNGGGASRNRSRASSLYIHNKHGEPLGQYASAPSSNGLPGSMDDPGAAPSTLPGAAKMDYYSATQLPPMSVGLGYAGQHSQQQHHHHQQQQQQQQQHPHQQLGYSFAPPNSGGSAMYLPPAPGYGSESQTYQYYAEKSED